MCLNIKYAPIAFFVYNRPEHTRRALEALCKSDGFDKSPLYIFSDGPKSSLDAEQIRSVRDTVHKITGNYANIVKAAINQGLATSVINGVSRLCNEYGRVIVIEDDLLVAPFFLDYMNAALQKYEAETSVMQISGYMFPVPEFSDRVEALFLPFTTSWGWATWKRAWDYFDPEATGWNKMVDDRRLRSKFNLEGSFDYFTMLKNQNQGKGDSWAIRWYWSVFKRNGIVLFPPASLVKNIGFDGSGTHGWRLAGIVLENETALSDVFGFPSITRVDSMDMEIIKRLLRKLSIGPLAKAWGTLKNRLSMRT
jgi:GT2 family glycosyltransferase